MGKMAWVVGKRKPSNSPLMAAHIPLTLEFMNVVSIKSDAARFVAVDPPIVAEWQPFLTLQ